MIYKSRRIRREILEHKIDARLVDVCRFVDSLLRDLSRDLASPAEEVCVTSAIRTRQEQMAILQRRKANAAADSRWADIDLRWESCHEKGAAVDIRIRNWAQGMAKEVARIVEAKFPEIQVIIESDHLHVELRETTRAANGWELKVEIQRTTRWTSKKAA